jgi:FkbM family methyltransferase
MGVNTMTETLINYKWKLNLLDFRATIPSWPFWEKERLAAMYNAIRPGDHILDIGAEQGDLSVLFKKWAGKDGKVTLVEPSPGFWPNIKATFEMNDEQPFRCYQTLVSNETTGNAAEHGGTWPDVANGEVSDDVGFSHLNEKPDIPVLKIDDMDLPKVDIITMDIEGSEYEALQGAQETIMRDKPILFISVHPEFMWKAHHHSTDDLHVMLDNWGYDATYLAFDHEQHYMYKARPA